MWTIYLLLVPKNRSFKLKLNALEVSYYEHIYKFGLIYEGEVGNFIGIRI